MILWPFYPRDQFLGGSQPMVVGNWLKSIFFLFLDHLPGFPNYTFLNFQKKFFSLHPNTTFFAFLLSIFADASLLIFSIDYRLFYAFCLHVIDWWNL